MYCNYSNETYWHKLNYINCKKAETDLAKNIKNKFGKDVILIQEDWSDKLKTTSRIKYISTPNLELKRKLNEYLTIYNIDEFRTSSPFQGFQSLIGSYFYKNNLLLNKYINLFI